MRTRSGAGNGDWLRVFEVPVPLSGAAGGAGAVAGRGKGDRHRPEDVPEPVPVSATTTASHTASQVAETLARTGCVDGNDCVGYPRNRLTHHGGESAMGRTWVADGSEFRLEWGGREWTLAPHSELPGLRSEDLGPLLGLEGLAAPGRREVGVFGHQALVEAEVRHGRVETVYRPAGWGDLSVRASWAPIGEESVDLVVEVSARSVGELRALEVVVLSTLEGPPRADRPRAVEPRDARAAALSYDGREPDLDGLATEPVGPLRAPWFVPKAGIEGWTYLELAHPDDVSRRVAEGRLPHRATRTCLFGHDLERGVVLRGRLRAAWLAKDTAFSRAGAIHDEFLAEPPPLTT